MFSMLMNDLAQKQQDVSSYLRAILTAAVTETIDSVVASHEEARRLKKDHVDRIVSAYVSRETGILPVTRPVCKGICIGRAERCQRKAKANGFCKIHADQYQAYEEKQRVSRMAVEKRLKNPMHNHPPSECLVDGCPMCDIKRREGNPFL